MKTKAYVVVILLLITNLIWGYLFFNAHKTKENPHVELYTLEGSSVHWQIKDYQIIVTPEKIERGHAEFVYVGEPLEIEHSDYYSISFYEGNPNGEEEVVYRTSSSSVNGSVNIIENVKNIGSISGHYDYAETLKTKSDYANPYTHIIWNDSEGMEHQERIDLVISKQFNLEEFIQ